MINSVIAVSGRGYWLMLIVIAATEKAEAMSQQACENRRGFCDSWNSRCGSRRQAAGDHRSAIIPKYTTEYRSED